MNNQFDSIPKISNESNNIEALKRLNMDTIKEYEKKVNVNVFKVIAVFISLIGAIAGIVWGKEEPIYDHYEKFFNVGLMLLTWFATDIIAVFLYVLALILEHLAKMNNILSIWNQTGIHINTVHVTKDKPFDFETEWKCRNCGKINSNHTGTCGCGQQKDEN